jgi:hypothetical protein
MNRHTREKIAGELIKVAKKLVARDVYNVRMEFEDVDNSGGTYDYGEWEDFGDYKSLEKLLQDKSLWQYIKKRMSYGWEAVSSGGEWEGGEDLTDENNVRIFRFVVEKDGKALSRDDVKMIENAMKKNGMRVK